MPGGSPLVVSVYVEGREAATKQRVVVPGSWDELTSLLQDKLQVPDIACVTDPSGSRIEFLEVIRDGDVLCVTPGSGRGGAGGGANASGGGSTPGAGVPPLPPGVAGPGGGAGAAGADGAGLGAMAGVSRADLVDMQILGCARASDFTLVRSIGGGQSGHVFVARCTRAGLSNPDRLYALKLVYNFGVATQVARNTFETEFEVLSQLPPHPNVTRFWAQFLDEIPDAALPHMPSFTRDQATYTDHSGATRRRRAQFVLLEYHPTTLSSHLGTMGAHLPTEMLMRAIADLLRAIAHFEAHHIAHLDLKLDNILVAEDGRLVVCDFGTAVRFPDASMTLPYSPGVSVGGNQMHLAPEVLNVWDRLRRGASGGGAASGGGGMLPYAKQEVWAVAVLAFEMAMGLHPFPDYPNDVGGAGHIAYDERALPELPAAEGRPYPDGLNALLHQMLALDPTGRPSAVDAVTLLEHVASEAGIDVTPVMALPEGAAGGRGSAGGGGGMVERMFGGLRGSSTPGARGSGAGTDARGTEVRVKAVDGTEGVVHTAPRDDVAALKAKAAAVLHPSKVWHEHQWVLLFAGRRLGDHERVTDLGLAAESVLHLVCLPAHDAMHGGPPEASMSPTDAPRVFIYDTVLKSPGVAIASDLTNASGAVWGSVRLVDSFTRGGVSSGVHTWEFRVQNKASTGGLCIGVCTEAFDARSKNVGAAPGSWGYSSSGKKSAGAPRFEPYGPGFGTRDTIHMRLDTEAATLSYAHNGRDLGVAFGGLPRGTVFFPAVCMGGKRPGTRELNHSISIVSTQSTGGADAAAATAAAEAALKAKAAAEADAALPLSHEDFKFSADKKSPHVEVSHDGKICSGARWGSVLLKYPPLQPDTGLHLFKFRIRAKARTGGVCIGVVDRLFDIRTKNVGASLGSWGYSSTGKKSDGSPDFVAYGARFGAGDLVGMEVDTTVGSIRFTLNGVDQGVAFSVGLRNHTLRAAVCVGGVSAADIASVLATSSADPTARGLDAGGHAVEAVEVARQFDPQSKGPAVRVTNRGATVSSTGWGSCFLLHSGYTADEGGGSNKATWSIRVDEIASSGGVCVGIAESDFPISRGNIGASPRSWAYSNSGKKSGGSPEFQSYAAAYGPGDVIGVELDLDRYTVSFAKNGVDLGVAFVDLPRGKRFVPAVCLGGARGRERHSLSVEQSTVYLPADAAARVKAATSDREGGRRKDDGHRRARSGSAGGAAAASIRTVPLAPFDRRNCNPVISMSTDDLTVESERWGSVHVDTEWVAGGGVHKWAFHIARKARTGGIVLGLVDRTTFMPLSHNVGASPGSWGYSSSGKKSAGQPTFADYAVPYGTGDVVEITANLDLGEVSFAVNGKDQGVAFRNSALRTVHLRPAVCMGGARGGEKHAVTVVPLISEGGTSATGASALAAAGAYLTQTFSMEERHRNTVLDPDRLTVDVHAWGSVLIEHPAFHSGMHCFHVQVVSKAPSGGICMGVVEVPAFDATNKNVGASAYSWGYSSSGKKSAGAPVFVDYADAYGTGDVIGIGIDMDEGTIRFSKNGRDQGIAFDRGIKGKRLVAAVCAGGVRPGERPHRLRIVQTPTAFDPTQANRAFAFSNGNRTMETTKWGSCYLQHPGMVQGIYRWRVRVDHKAQAGGICIGIADVRDFDVAENNVGADRGSWGYSSLGKRSAGAAEFEPYAAGFGTGDVVGVELDMDNGTLRFSKNGEDLGIAFDADVLGSLAGRRILPAVCAGGSRSVPHKLTVLEEEL